MKIVCKKMNELTTKELFDIYKLRVDVFVVEQKCPYHEIDDYDLKALHVYYLENGKIQGYLRILPAHTAFEDVSIGRVIAVKRHCGIGSSLLRTGMQMAENVFQAKRILVEAQVYAKELYAKQGFVQISDEFLEDGIPHVRMLYTKS